MRLSAAAVVLGLLGASCAISSDPVALDDEFVVAGTTFDVDVTKNDYLTEDTELVLANSGLTVLEGNVTGTLPDDEAETSFVYSLKPEDGSASQATVSVARADLRVALALQRNVLRVGETAEITVGVERRLGERSWEPVADASISLNVISPGLDLVLAPGRSCTTDTAGKCLVRVTANTAGDASFVVATGTLNVYGVRLERTVQEEISWVDASLGLTASPIARIGDDVPVTATLLIDDGDGLSPRAGASIELTTSGGPAGAALNSTDCTTGVEGSCTVVLTSPATGIVGVVGETNVDVSGMPVQLRRDVEVRWADARLILSSSTNAARIGSRIAAEAQLEVDRGDGRGYAPAPGVPIVFSVGEGSSGAAPFAGGTTCTTDSAGECVVDTNVKEPSLARIVASATPRLDDADLQTRATIEMRWVDAILTLTAPDVVETGTDVTFQASLIGHDGERSVPLDDVVVTLSGIGADGSTAPLEPQCTTGSDGTCAVIAPAPLSGGIVRAPVPALGQLSVTASASPQVAGVVFNDIVASASTRWVTATLTHEPPPTEEFGQPVEVTVLVTGSDGTVAEAPLAGVELTFVLRPNDANASFESASTCTTGVEGTCSVAVVGGGGSNQATLDVSGSVDLGLAIALADEVTVSWFLPIG